MPSYVLWVLDHEIDPSSFERLCVDLLCREGYPNIVPVGRMHDRGRDAECFEVTTNRRIFFQFSLQDDWERKLQTELDKVSNYGHAITDYVFVTSRTVSGAARDRWTPLVAAKYGWRLRLLDREWLRLQLEEKHTGLADRYLGTTAQISDRLKVPAPGPRVALRDEISKDAWAEMKAGRYDAAIVAFQRLLEVEPNRADAWAGLAWSHYQLFHYDDALSASAHALALEPSELQWQSMRACILTESGIESASHTSILEASGIFASIASHSLLWIDHYNYANALAALERHDQAVASYRRALDLDDSNAEVWKNLGSSLHHLGEHEEEMRCLDRALTINPSQPQALMSKGVSTLIDQNNPEEAIRLIERAHQLAPRLFDHWPTGWNWLVRAYLAIDDLDTALNRIQTATKSSPGDESLRNLEGLILHRLWHSRPELIPEALRVNQLLHNVRPENYGYVAELVALWTAIGDEAPAWRLLVSWYERFGLGKGEGIRASGAKIEEVANAFRFLPGYLTFRRIRPIEDYLSGATSIQNTVRQSTTETDNRIEHEIGIVEGLSSTLAVAFGTALAILDDASGRRPRAATLKAIQGAAAVLASAIPNVFEVAAKYARSLDLEGRIDWISEAVAHAPLIALVELSSLAGWMMGNQQPALPSDACDGIIKRVRFEPMQTAIIERTFLQANQQLEIIPVR